MSNESDQNPSVAVIVRCRNEEAHIGRLLTGIVRQARQVDQIIVVDSGSTDATLSIAQSFPTEVVHIPPDEFSFGAACNIGCANADTDIAIFVSAHCYPLYDSWIERLCAPFSDPEVAVTYGRQVGPPEARFPEKRLFEQWFPDRSVERQKLPFCNNANAAIRLDLWRDGHRYDEELTGLEDLAWAKQSCDLGYFVSYVAEAPVVHVHDESVSQIVNRYRREAIAHREIYDKQAMRFRQAVRLAALTITKDYSAAREQGALSANLIDIPRFRLAQFYGTYRGFLQNGQVTENLKRRFYFPDDPGSGSQDETAESLGRPIDYESPVHTPRLRK